MPKTTHENPKLPSARPSGSAATCDWIMWPNEHKLCGNPATHLNPPSGKRFCAKHVKRFHGFGVLEAIPPNAAGERPR